MESLNLSDFYEIAILFGASIAGFLLSYSNIFSLRRSHIGENYSDSNSTSAQGLTDFDPDKDEFFYSEEEMSNNDSKMPEELQNLFICSLDYSTMKTPVIDTFGYTYEKDTILNWLDKKSECPFTKQTLHKKDLRVNRSALDLVKFLVLKEKYNKINMDDQIKFEEIFH